MINSVEVLLSVYAPNWLFLKEQLSTVFNQESVSVRVTIRDDTGDITHLHQLEVWLKKTFPNEKIYLFGGGNLGPAKSFLKLCFLSDMQSDYYAFCDQDDYWSAGKLVRAIECMKSEKAGLYASVLDVTDQELNVSYRTSKPEKISFDNSLAENVVTGCTAVFDREVMGLVRACEPSYVSMHDHWVYMIASAFSNVYFDEKSFTKYRQHGGNVVGAKSWGYYVNKITLFIRDLFKDKKRTSDQVVSFYFCYSGNLNNVVKKQCEHFLGLKRNFIRRLLCFNCFSRNGVIENFVFRIKFIIGAY